MKIVLWLILIALVVILGFESRSLEQGTAQHYSIMQLEFADAAQGKTMLQTWQQTGYAGRTLLELVKSNTHTDFFFLLVYTILLITHSNGQMQQERKLILNTLLRLNLFLAVIAGIADATENFILLYDIRHTSDATAFISSCWVSSLKWTLIACILLVWLVSVIHTAIIAKKKLGFVTNIVAT